MNASPGHPSHGNLPDPEADLRDLINSMGSKAMRSQLDQAADIWTGMITHAGAIRKHAIRQGLGMKQSRRLAVAFIAKCVGVEVSL